MPKATQPRPKRPKPSSVASTGSKLTSRLKLTRSPLAIAFRHLQPSWREYMTYVEIAAREGDEDMLKVFSAYTKLPLREQSTITPEQLCDLTGVKGSVLFGAVCAHLWANNNREATMIAAIAHPKIVERSARLSMQKGGIKDRENFLKATGFLPIPQGSRVTINNSPQMANISGTGPGKPIALPSMEDDMLELENLTTLALPPAPGA